MKRQLYIIILAASAALLQACGSEGWRLEGTAPDGIDTVFIQAPTTAGGWYKVDSAAVKSGKYAFSLPRANSEIYRVDLGNRSVYVPADSTETVTLTADGRRGGSAEALLFNTVDSVVSAGGDAKAMLRALDGRYASTAAYYATRLVRNRLLLRTVANRYVEERPDDPRTAVVRAELVKMMPKNSQPADRQVILADEIGYFDIELMNRNGRMQKLSDVVEANPLVVLAYVDFTDDNAQAITRALGDAQSAGAAIYEVGFSDNQHTWAAATEGLPWVSVYQSDAADKMHISRYAVARFPTFFILKNGEIVDRLSDYTALNETLRKHK